MDSDNQVIDDKPYNRWKNLDSHWHNIHQVFKYNSPALLAIITIFIYFGFIHYNNTINEILENQVLQYLLPVIMVGVFCYILAYLCYAYYCPMFIKHYPNYAYYEKRQHSPRWLVWEFYYLWKTIDMSTARKVVERMRRKGCMIQLKEKKDNLPSTPFVSTYFTSYTFQFDETYYNVEASESLSSTWQKDFFWEIFGAWTASKSIIRQIIWLLYLAFNSIMVISIITFISLIIFNIGQNI